MTSSNLGVRLAAGGALLALMIGCSAEVEEPEATGGTSSAQTTTDCRPSEHALHLTRTEYTYRIELPEQPREAAVHVRDQLNSFLGAGACVLTVVEIGVLAAGILTVVAAPITTASSVAGATMTAAGCGSWLEERIEAFLQVAPRITWTASEVPLPALTVDAECQMTCGSGHEGRVRGTTCWCAYSPLACNPAAGTARPAPSGTTGSYTPPPSADPAPPAR